MAVVTLPDERHSGPFDDDRSPVTPDQLDLLRWLYPGCPPAYLAIWMRRIRGLGVHFRTDGPWPVGRLLPGVWVQASVFVDGDAHAGVVCQVIDGPHHGPGMTWRLRVVPLCLANGRIVGRREARWLRIPKGSQAALTHVTAIRGGY